MYSYGTNASTTTITTIEMRFFAQQKLEPGRGMPFIYEPISWGAQIPVTFWAFLPQGNRFGTNQDSHPLPKTIERQHSATGWWICGTQRKGIFLEILMTLSYFKPKKSSFWPFLIENWSKFHKIGDFCCKKSSKFEGNSKINISP